MTQDLKLEVGDKVCEVNCRFGLSKSLYFSKVIRVTKKKAILYGGIAYCIDGQKLKSDNAPSWKGYGTYYSISKTLYLDSPELRKEYDELHYK